MHRMFEGQVVRDGSMRCSLLVIVSLTKTMISSDGAARVEDTIAYPACRYTIFEAKRLDDRYVFSRRRGEGDGAFKMSTLA